MADGYSHYVVISSQTAPSKETLLEQSAEAARQTFASEIEEGSATVAMTENSSLVSLEVTLDDEFTMYIACATGEELADEIAEIIESHELEAESSIAGILNQGSALVSLWSDPDDEMVHFNDMIMLVGDVEELFPGSIVIDAYNMEVV